MLLVDGRSGVGPVYPGTVPGRRLANSRRGSSRTGSDLCIVQNTTSQAEIHDIKSNLLADQLSCG